MNTLQLEQLISGYIDGELSPGRKSEVENLLQHDPAAKKLYKELMFLRKEIRQIRRRNLPHDFQKKLFERIDRETVSIAGKLVEQSTSVDFTLPVADVRQKQEFAVTPQGSRFRLARRLKHPRVLALPVAVLMITLVFVVFSFRAGNQNTAHLSPPTDVPVIDEPTPSVPPPPLPGRDRFPGNPTVQPLTFRDGKPVVEVTLDLSQAARDGEYIPKLLADNGYAWVKRENGNKAVTVYEFEMPAERLLPMIALLYASRDEVLDYTLPEGILSLLHRPMPPGDSDLQEPAVSTIVMHWVVSKDK